MIRASTILQLTTSLLLLLPATAAATTSTDVTCQSLLVDGISQDICVTYSATGSPTSGTYDFSFWEGVENGTDTTSLENREDYATSQPVSVTWEDNKCAVKISSEQCSSCTVCRKQGGSSKRLSLSVDCTNIDQGRMVDCEPAFILYPFVAEATVSLSQAGLDLNVDVGDDGNGGNADSGASEAKVWRSFAIASLFVVTGSFV